MELKLLANTEPRKKFHMTRKLKKAVAYAEELQTLCEIDKVDARTKLESQVCCFCEWLKESGKKFRSPVRSEIC